MSIKHSSNSHHVHYSWSLVSKIKMVLQFCEALCKQWAQVYVLYIKYSVASLDRQTDGFKSRTRSEREFEAPKETKQFITSTPSLRTFREFTQGPALSVNNYKQCLDCSEF